MTSAGKKSVLIVIRHSPYGSSLARASLDTALAAAAFEQPVQLLFMGDGVLQLLANQDSKAIGARNMGSLLSSLPLYDINSVYVDAEAGLRYGVDLSRAPVAAKSLAGSEIHQLMSSFDHLLGF